MGYLDGTGWYNINRRRRRSYSTARRHRLRLRSTIDDSYWIDGWMFLESKKGVHARIRSFCLVYRVHFRPFTYRINPRVSIQPYYVRTYDTKMRRERADKYQIESAKE